MSPQPPLTAVELFDLFDKAVPSEIVGQLRIDAADDRERRSLDKLNIRIWKGKS